MFCMFGYHKWIVTNRVSLLHYMYLALGKTIVEIDASVLITMMRQLILELPVGVVCYDYIEVEKLVSLFQEDDVSFMRQHLDNISSMSATCKDALATVQKIEQEIQKEVYSHIKERLRADRVKLLAKIQPQLDTLSIATAYLSLQFCTRCHKTYDPREQLGVFLPKIKSQLDVAKRNEENGYFLSYP